MFIFKSPFPQGSFIAMTDTGLNRLCCSPASGFNTEILLCADFCLLYFNSIQLSSFIFLFLLILLLQAILQANMQSKIMEVGKIQRQREFETGDGR
jgi:hypothetical protein